MALLVAACTAPDGASGPVHTGDTASDPGPLGYAVSGSVLDLSGAPLVDVFVTVSTEFCIPDRTDANGAFTVEQVTDGPKRLITYGETASNGLFASVAFAFDATGQHVFDTAVHTPALTEILALDADSTEVQTVQTADGLILGVEAGALTYAPLQPEELQVARVPVELAPPVVPPGIELVDLFVLHPILSTIDPPAAVTFPADTGLVPGTRVRFHALDYASGLLTEVAAGAVDADGRATSDPGQGLPELTWVGLSLE